MNLNEIPGPGRSGNYDVGNRKIARRWEFNDHGHVTGPVVVPFGMVLEDIADHSVSGRISNHKNVVGTQHVRGHLEGGFDRVALGGPKPLRMVDYAKVAVGPQVQELIP